MLNKFFILLLIPFIATSVIAETVAYSAINVDDNWAEIVQILDA